jgi:hypothetical protein
MWQQLRGGPGFPLENWEDSPMVHQSMMTTNDWKLYEADHTEICGGVGESLAGRTCLQVHLLSVASLEWILIDD